MGDVEIPEQLRYSREDEWARREGERVTIGVTDYAQQQLGDVVFVELPEVGRTLEKGEPFGVIESVKTVADLYAPVSGEVVECNEALAEAPESVNDDCYGEGWMIVVQLFRCRRGRRAPRPRGLCPAHQGSRRLRPLAAAPSRGRLPCATSPTPRRDPRDVAVVGEDDVVSLFDTVPEKLRFTGDLDVPQALGELEVDRLLSGLAAGNRHAATRTWFLGAGTYAHFVPSAVDALISRAELTTSYTPYQPEISQGTLQTIFEWQTMIGALTGMDVANASMYDGASSTAEAALMAMRITRRAKRGGERAVCIRTLARGDRYLSRVASSANSSRRFALGDDGFAASSPTLDDDDGLRDRAAAVNFLGCRRGPGAPPPRAARATSGRPRRQRSSEALSLALLRPPGRLAARTSSAARRRASACP